MTRIRASCTCSEAHPRHAVSSCTGRRHNITGVAVAAVRNPALLTDRDVDHVGRGVILNEDVELPPVGPVERVTYARLGISSRTINRNAESTHRIRAKLDAHRRAGPSSIAERPARLTNSHAASRVVVHNKNEAVGSRPGSLINYKRKSGSKAVGYSHP